MQVEIKNRDNHMAIDGLVCVKQAMEMLGYTSRNSVTNLADKGDIRYCWVSFGHPSATRLFFKKDIERVVQEKRFS